MSDSKLYNFRVLPTERSTTKKNSMRGKRRWGAILVLAFLRTMAVEQRPEEHERSRQPVQRSGGRGHLAHEESNPDTADREKEKVAREGVG